MTFRKRREALRSILARFGCIRPGSVYDAVSIRIAEDLGFEVGMFGGSVASLAVLGDPDIALITLTELSEQMRRISRASVLPVLVDVDHGYGNALNARLASTELTGRVTREAEVNGRLAQFLGHRLLDTGDR
jgi:oxaloacetate decarboxylase